jgi:hypothetical protein
VVRKEEMAKVKAAYAVHPRYHPAAQSSMAAAHEAPTVRPIREAVAPLALARNQQRRLGRSRSPTKRGQKRANRGSNTIAPEGVEDEITVNTGSQRPVRTITPSRRALEALDANSARLHSTHQTDNMDIDRCE